MNIVAALLSAIWMLQEKALAKNEFHVQCSNTLISGFTIHHSHRKVTHQHQQVMFATRTFPNLPGLVLKEDALSRNQCEKIFHEVVHASKMAQKRTSLSDSPGKVSPAHNIPIRSEYIPVELPLEKQFSAKKSSLSAEHFQNYGQGHYLTYFRGNDNIPRLGLPLNFLERLLSFEVIEQEIQSSRQRLGMTTVPDDGSKYKWRLTMNYYPSAGKVGGRVGFPWHRDLEANGAVSVVLGLGSPGTLEFGEYRNSNLPGLPPKDNLVERPDAVKSVESVILRPGSLLVLTGPARWHFVHRVLCSFNGRARASLVYGIW